jgi:hypothetical protein
MRTVFPSAGTSGSTLRVIVLKSLNSDMWFKLAEFVLARRYAV